MKSAVHISRDTTALIAIVERLLTGYCRTIPLGTYAPASITSIHSYLTCSVSVST